MRGMWGEAADRARRPLRQSEGKEQDSHSRLQRDSGGPAGHPNGVVLLDSEGHIEWCNQIAASQFGIDAPARCDAVHWQSGARS